MPIKFIPKEIVLATHNEGKATELRALLSSMPITIYSAKDFNLDSVAETGSTFIENAIIKARHVAELTGLAALADDSGLCVNHLQGGPIVYSARYSSTGSDKDNINKLLNALKDVDNQHRYAFFQCSLVLMQHANDPTPLISEAQWHGSILKKPEGENGFGYDPIFKPKRLTISAAILSPEAKQQSSHRAQALFTEALPTQQRCLNYHPYHFMCIYTGVKRNVLIVISILMYNRTTQKLIISICLLGDLRSQIPMAQGRQLTSIFFGGGTPSLFSADSIGKVINATNKLIGFKDPIEITLEANPSSSEYQKI